MIRAIKSITVICCLLTLALAPILSENAKLRQSPDASFLPTGPQWLVRGNARIVYDASRRCPAVVVMMIDRESIRPVANRKGLDFQPDPSFADEWSVDDADYQRSGYDQGHLWPAQGATGSPELLRQTFTLANCAPQLHSFNAGIWLRAENDAISLARQHGRVWRVAVALWLPDDHGRVSYSTFCGIHVPTHFADSILWFDSESRPRIVTRLFPHGKCDGPLDSYRVSVDRLESLCGVDLWGVLDDRNESRLETAQ